ncbi:MAG: PIN domain-containing protein [Acidobacteria bacterium]|nr:PIN domain-containing protein [Acidobacteriota bacterium]
MIFIDTSAIYALADRADVNHSSAVRALKHAVIGGEQLLTHNYVVLESLALLHRRLGFQVVHKFLNDTEKFQIRWIDQALHSDAVRRFSEKKGSVSVVDEVSFLVMEELRIGEAFAFDADFEKRGFRLYRPSV